MTLSSFLPIQTRLCRRVRPTKKPEQLRRAIIKTISQNTVSLPGEIRRREREEFTTQMRESESSYMLKSTISIEWIVHAPKGGKVKVIARHERAGTVRIELELK